MKAADAVPPLQVLIVDDEAPARARLARLLAAHADVQIVGHAGDGLQALEQVERLQPALLLLDVQMPGLDGLDLAASLPDPAPLLIFVTAHDRYAVQAFEHAALDYLLKPVEPERLARTLARVRERLGVGPGSGPLPPARSGGLAPSRLLVAERQGAGLVQRVVPVADIQWLEAADNYVALHTRVQEPAPPLLRRPLAALLQDLGPGFVRCHRSAAVALAHVQALQPREGGEAELLLRCGARVRCSRSQKAEVMARLSAPSAR